jgi:hypothetical protein
MVLEREALFNNGAASHPEMITRRERHNAYEDVATIPQQIRAQIKQNQELKKRMEEISKES